ncbi:MAG: alpha/beta hydrolase [Chloroflexi bacterium]|nr:alpha/beta hydrolase [Chloroflexota bacterium]
MPSSLAPRRAQIDSFFTCQHPEQFRIDWRVFYTRAEARTDDVRARWAHELDLAYGPSEYHRLDLYLPVPRAGGDAFRPQGWPVLIFLHGGGFREGDPALYGYIAEPFLARGIAFITCGYRLTPESYLPDTFTDVENALAWCVTNLPARGVDVGRLALSGHSAGAILSAQLAVRSDWLSQHGLPRDLVKVAIPISGVYDFTDADDRREFFAEGSDRVASSPLRGISTTPPPMLVAYGSDENQPTYGIDSQKLVEAVRGVGGRADWQELEGMTHADTADALGDASSPLFEAVMRLLASVQFAPGEVATTAS